MEVYETVIDKRCCKILYVVNEEDMEELLIKEECILNITYYPNEDELLTAEQFRIIFKGNEYEILSGIKWILETDIYKNIDFNTTDKWISVESRLNRPEYFKYYTTDYVDYITFKYYS